MNTLIQLDSQMAHLPAGVVVALFAIALGYVLKSSEFFPNNRIPLVIVCVTSVVFPIVQLCEDRMNHVEEFLWHAPLNVLLGVVIGFLAWTFHAQILRRFVDPKLFNDDGSTKFLKRDKGGN